MSNRYGRYDKINGHRVEFATDLILPQDRHFHREAKSQKAQLNSVHKHGTNKGRKIPIKRKLT